MKYLPWRLLLLIICIVVTSYGCFPRPNNLALQNDEEAFKIIFPDSGDSIEIGVGLPIAIENTTKNCYEFDSDFGITYEVILGNEIITANDSTFYLNKIKIRIEPMGEFFAGNMTTLLPNLEGMDIKERTRVEAIINGRICDDPSKPVSQRIPFFVLPGKVTESEN